MAEAASKRTRRTPEERAAELDQKIQKHQEAVKVLEKKKREILHPPKRKTDAQLSRELLLRARRAGLSPLDIARRLGLEAED